MKKQTIPTKGFSALKTYFKDDLLAGFSVSLIALPLCLGIAIASGVPPLAGLITAIIGGIIASRISGTFVTISGPAAGLIVITLGAAEAMGGAGADAGYAGYPHALGAIIIGGLIMTLFGILKVGKVGDYFPSAAVHGMLAAIGIIIIIKQFFPALGVPSLKGEILEVAQDIPHAFLELNPFALGISILSLVILIVHPLLKVKLIKIIPAPMWVLLFTIPLAAFLGTEHLEMVKMPHNLFGEGGFQLPSFAKIGETSFWIAVTGFALVSSIESLLSAKAVDSLDPYKRSSNLNKDLISMGAGSSLAATIGGLPMISEIVRSSANVNNGAKTQWSNFYHGCFLLIYLLIGVVVIEMIPISALAAMLVFTGFKLASPKEFKHMYQIGLMELEVFIVTLAAVLATDLIIGIVIGILFKYALLLFKGTKLKELFKSQFTTEHKGQQKLIYLKGSQIFSNYLSLKKKMDHGVETYNEVVLDFADVTFVDHTVMEHLEDYARLAAMNGKQVHIRNVDSLHPLSNHPLSAREKNGTNANKKTNISERTLDQLDFANEHDFHFQNKSKSDQWHFFDFTIRKELISVENIIEFNHLRFTYSIADVITRMGTQITEDFEKETVLKISGLNNLPKFYLHHSSFIDNLKDRHKNNEISFPNHQKFEKDYTVVSDGMNKETIELLNKDVIEILENNTNLALSSNGKDLLLKRNSVLLEKNDVLELIQIGKQIVEVL